MFISLLLILLLTVGGLGATYLFAEDEPFLWRVCVGNIVGSTVFGLVCFALACVFGLTILTISLSLLINLLPILVFARKPNLIKLKNDWQKAKSGLEGANFKKFLRFAYYAFFLVLFYLFFDRAIIETANGIFTGASQNYGDLPFHLGAIFSFTEGNNFPPENPSYAFAKFSYPFISDLITAAFVKCGASVGGATLAQNVTLAFSLLVILERFVFKLTRNKLAGKIAPVLLFFSGGLGFLWFLSDYQHTAQNLFDFLWKLPRDYTIGEKFRWGNSLVALFVTQRSLLLGLPLTIIILQKLWEIFNDNATVEDAETERQGDAETRRRAEKEKEKQSGDEKNSRIDSAVTASPRLSVSALLPAFVVGLLAGNLPLIHVHSLAVLFVVSAFLYFLRMEKWRDWIAFGIGVCVVAVPELVWVMTGSATRLTEFVGWHFGWDKRQENFLWFWLKNTGAFFPVLACGIFIVFKLKWHHSDEDENEKNKKRAEIFHDENYRTNLLLFYLPFALLFFASNIIKFAPWEWDNVKILIYWFVGSLPFVALVLAWLWNQDKILKIVAVGCLIVLTFAGALDVWRGASKAIEYNVFSRDSVAIAEQIKQKLAPNALILNAPTFNSAVVLSGRRSLMRYTGHLASYGIDYGERESDVKRIYAGDAAASVLLKKYNIEYVLVSPEERSNLPLVNEEFFKQFPVVAESGDYRLYQVKK